MRQAREFGKKLMRLSPDSTSSEGRAEHSSDDGRWDGGHAASDSSSPSQWKQDRWRGRKNAAENEDANENENENQHHYDENDRDHDRDRDRDRDHDDLNQDHCNNGSHAEKPPPPSEEESPSEETTTRLVDAAFLDNFNRRNRSSALDVARSSLASRCSADDDFDWEGGGEPIKGLVRDMEERIRALQPLLGDPSTGAAQDPSVGGGVDMSADQRRALEGLSSNFHRLLNCLRVHHYSGAVEDDEVSDALVAGSRRRSWAIRGTHNERRRNPLSQSLTETIGASAQRLLDSADTPSAKTLLHSVLEPEPSHRRHKTSILAKASDASSSGIITVQKGNFSCEIPAELIYDMMRRDDPEHSASAAYLAREYGGVELPAEFTGKTKKTKPSLRAIAKKVSISNSFVRRLNASRCVGMETLEYLPIEFTRLGWKERRRLARVLSWEGLRMWGFDSFEVEKLSMGTTAEHKSLSRPGVDRTFSTPHLLSGEGIQRMLERGGSFDPNSTSPLSQSLGQGETCTTVAENESDKLDQSEKSNSDEGPEVLEISNRGCPVVLMGWALFASPYSQLAMAKNVVDDELIEQALAAIENNRKRKKSFIDSTRSSMSDASFDEGERPERDSSISTNTGSSTSASKPNTGWDGGYFFCDKFNITPKSLCQFFRKVEREYSPRTTNPYHNNIHAADVIQATHAIIQMGGAELAQAYVPLEFYSILLAASLHDVRHPGTSNNYQINAQTELAVIYNDSSVLENMHASRASYLLKLGEGKPDEWADGIRGIFGSMNDNDRKLVRTRIIRAILYTDMSRHFSEVAKMNRHVDAVEDDIQDELLELEERAIDEDRYDIPPVPEPSFLSRIGRDKHLKAREKLLPFILHLADISNATKTHKVSLEWAHAVYDEFFLQGDKEMEEDMPVSPLCDRSTTNRVESQIGFINFVIKPAFLLLARCIPSVEKVIVCQMEKNLKYWEGEKAKAKAEKERRETLLLQVKEE